MTPQTLGTVALLPFLVASCNGNHSLVRQDSDPVDCVNPYMGNVSHLLVPTYPTVQLPNSMMRIYPKRSSYTDEQIQGLPLIVTNHRESSAFALSPVNSLSDSIGDAIPYIYDDEQIRPYSYSVYLPDQEIGVRYVPASHSALYELRYAKTKSSPSLILHTEHGVLRARGKSISGYQVLADSITKVYLYMETATPPTLYGVRNPETGRVIAAADSVSGTTLALQYPSARSPLMIRYGVSFISEEQAKHNVEQEIQTYDLDLLSKAGRNAWQDALGKIEVKEGTEQQRAVFYTSLYRTYERMICLSEQGRYYSGVDKRVHEDNGVPYYTDDWVWDTYRAVHPLRLLLDPIQEKNILASYLRMAQQSLEGWLPTFPEVIGDTHRMNGNHAIALFADAYAKGLTDFDLQEAYRIAKKSMEERSLLPWTRIPKEELSHYFDKHGYFPALRPEQSESHPEVTLWEKRQAVATSLAAYYDYWCLSQLATFSGQVAEAKDYLARSYNYRNIFNYKTSFFHPKDEHGVFITPFDYELSGGLGARDYYDENNAYTYRWDVVHNPADLIYLMGGQQRFIANLDECFHTPLSKPRWQFYAQLPDQTGNVGQFSMGNEPSMHIPYLYNYAGAPWRTQRAVRKLLRTWFRDDLMGVPGDEDGGGLSAFVVFSMIGLYPVTPGMPIYNIGSPCFPEIKIHLPNGKTFTIKAENVSESNMYIQKAELNGERLDRPWIYHKELIKGGTLYFKMGSKPNKEWGAHTPPPSAEKVTFPLQ